MIARAVTSNWNTTDISNSVQDVLKETCGKWSVRMELRKMVNDRQEFAPQKCRTT